jgi:hypothetical protein
MRTVATGTTGTPGPPLHQPPRHELGCWGMESGREGADISARTDTSPCNSVGSRCRSFCEVTRCEQPARTSADVSPTQTRSITPAVT